MTTSSNRVLFPTLAFFSVLCQDTAQPIRCLRWPPIATQNAGIHGGSSTIVGQYWLLMVNWWLILILMVINGYYGILMVNNGY